MTRKPRVRNTKKTADDQDDIVVWHRKLQFILEHGSEEHRKAVIDLITSEHTKLPARPPCTKKEETLDWLKTGRWMADVTIEELAARSGLDKQTIVNIERGKWEGVSIHALFSYLRGCGVKPNGNTLAKLREEQGITIQQVAAKIGIQPREVRRLEAAFDRGLRNLTRDRNQEGDTQ
jgi:transcriptional regulator with XRE-family HTH domain